MKIIILPGFSPHNKNWAEEIKQRFAPVESVVLHYWQHWQTGKGVDFEPEVELKRILAEINNEKVGLIAKSIGAWMAMKVLEQLPHQIEKMILAGLSVGISETKSDSIFQNLTLLKPTQVLIFQNLADPYASFATVESLIKEINPAIKVIPKDRADHEYPYFDEFQEFLFSSARSTETKALSQEDQES